MSQEFPFGFFTPGWWLEAPSWHLQKLHSQFLFGSLEEEQCPPRRVARWGRLRCSKVHSVLLEGQIHIQSLGPEIAPRSRDPLESWSVNSGGESLSRLLLELSLQALKWKMRPKTGSFNTELCIGADASWTWARSSPKPAQLENSLIPSQLENS